MLANIDLIIWRHWIVVSKSCCDSVWSLKPFGGGGLGPQCQPPMSCKLTLLSEWFTPPKKYCLKTYLLSPNDRPPVELSTLLTPPKWKFVMTTLSDCDSNDIQSNWLLDIGSCCHLNGIYKMVPYPRHSSWIFSLASNIFPWNPRNLSSLNIIFSWHQIVTKKKTSNH